MHLKVGLPFTAVIVVVMSLVNLAVGFPLSWVVYLSSAIWVGVDSKKISLVKYKSGISYSPFFLIPGVSLLFVVAFPWYLHVRYKIRKGLAEPAEAMSRGRALLVTLVRVLVLGVGWIWILVISVGFVALLLQRLGLLALE
jgi:hypothetical protein